MQENLLGLCMCKEMRHADEMYDLEARNAVIEVEVTWGITQSTSAFAFKKLKFVWRA